MTIQELIAALEKAEGPSRELDIEIFCTLPIDGIKFSRFSGILPRGSSPEKSLQLYAERFASYFTSSIDAALTLVPEGCENDIEISMSLSWHRKTSVTLANGDWNNPETKQVSGDHSEPAIALCIAALKARTE